MGYSAAVAPEDPVDEESGSYLLDECASAGPSTGDFLGLSFQDLRLSINSRSILDGVDAWVPKGKLLAVLGPSGEHTLHEPLSNALPGLTTWPLQAQGRRRCSTFWPRSARLVSSRVWQWRT